MIATCNVLLSHITNILRFAFLDQVNLSNRTRNLHKLWGQNRQNNHTHTFQEDKQANHIFSWPPHPAWWSFHSSWDIKRWECYGNTASSHPTLFKVWGNWDDRNITNKSRHNHRCYARAHFQFKEFMQVPTKTTKKIKTVCHFSHDLCTLLTFPVWILRGCNAQHSLGVKAKKQIDDVLSQRLFLLLHPAQSIGPRFG